MFFSKSTEKQKQNQPRPKGNTGSGKKASGKRQRCRMAGCQTFESPAHTGFCSFHEMQALTVGESTTVLRQRVCADCKGLCERPRPGEEEPEFCKDCTEWRVAMNTGDHLGYKGDKPLIWGLGDEPLNHPAKRHLTGSKPTPVVCQHCGTTNFIHKEDCPVTTELKCKVKELREAHAKPKPTPPLLAKTL
jgi:hypothetical protein